MFSYKASLASILFTAALATNPRNSTLNESSAFDWDRVTPTPQLVYHDCYDTFQCARLEVPLDWHNTSDSRRAAIAIIKLPAAVPENDTSFAGTVVANPGGPGGSGVYQGLQSSTLLQAVIDKPNHRHYEIVWFDPRGINHSTPASECFESDLTRAAWTIENMGTGGMNGVGPGGVAKGSMAYKLALNKGFAAHCTNYENKHGPALAYVGTASVARDMVEIVDRIDEHRNSRRNNGTSSALGSDYELDKRYLANTTVPRIQYIGFSYGTVIGNYFASMFPGRVERMVLDGVLDAVDYTTGPGWTTNLVDTDRIFDEFWRGCFAAGPEICELADGTDPASAQSRFWTWVNSLDEMPYSFLGAHGNVNILTGDVVRRYLATLVYSPAASFRQMPGILHDAMRGNQAALAEIFTASGKPVIQDVCQGGQNGTVHADDLDPDKIEIEAAIVCGDGDDVSDKDVSWWTHYADTIANQSRVLGRYWSSTRLIALHGRFVPTGASPGRSPHPLLTPP